MQMLEEQMKDKCIFQVAHLNENKTIHIHCKQHDVILMTFRDFSDIYGTIDALKDDKCRQELTNLCEMQR